MSKNVERILLRSMYYLFSLVVGGCDMEVTKREIEIVVRQLGGNGTYKGFNYLVYAIDVTMRNPDLLTHVCKGLYVDIATHYHTTIECAERDIRTMKIVIFQSGNREMLNEIFGNVSHDNIPTNSESIDKLVTYLKYA